jgi:deoxyadenosine/deoxycytidine kinase
MGFVKQTQCETCSGSGTISLGIKIKTPCKECGGKGRKNHKGDEHIIVIGGMIGVGKSSYTDLISKHLGSEAFYESVDDNRLLDKFYYDKERWAFGLQIYFLNTRFRDIKKAMRHRNNVLDRSIYEDALFSRINYEEGNMSEAEFDTYLDLLDNMLEEIETLEDTAKKRPDLFIYLRASFDTIEGRIRKRGREFEQWDNDPEQEAYMRNLHSRYDDWVFNQYDKSQVLVIDADKFDITRSEDVKEVLALVDKKLSELDRERIDY